MIDTTIRADPEKIKQYWAFDEILRNPSLKARITPYFFQYYREFIHTEAGIKGFFYRNALLFDLLELRDKTILDIGCGFGLTSICFSLLGAKQVVGIDISEDMINGFNTLIGYLPDRKITALKMDFLAEGITNRNYDCLFLFNAISHIRDTESLLDKITAMSAPGSTLVIGDGNNDIFLPTRIHSHSFQRKAEFGDGEKKKFKYGRKEDALPFRKARCLIISDIDKTLSDREVRFIARKTQGMYGNEIVKSVNEYKSTGKISQKASYPYRNPYTGEFSERGFSPYKLARSLKARGFKSTFLPPLATYKSMAVGLELKGWKGFVVRRLSPFFVILHKIPKILLPFFNPYFLIVAKKL